jgi:hypothetical protein
MLTSIQRDSEFLSKQQDPCPKHPPPLRVAEVDPATSFPIATFHSFHMGFLYSTSEKEIYMYTKSFTNVKI